MKKIIWKLGIVAIVATLLAIELFATNATPSTNKEVVYESSQGCPAVDPIGCTVLLPVPGSCPDFYSCSNGVPILMHCPDGLYFNDELDVCDWPRNVSCY